MYVMIGYFKCEFSGRYQAQNKYTTVFPACRKRRLKGIEREGWGISSSVFYPQEEMRQTGGRECCLLEPWTV